MLYTIILPLGGVTHMTFSEKADFPNKEIEFNGVGFFPHFISSIMT